MKEKNRRMFLTILIVVWIVTTSCYTFYQVLQNVPPTVASPIDIFLALISILLCTTSCLILYIGLSPEKNWKEFQTSCNTNWRRVVFGLITTSLVLVAITEAYCSHGITPLPSYSYWVIIFCPILCMSTLACTIMPNDRWNDLEDHCKEVWERIEEECTSICTCLTKRNR